MDKEWENVLDFGDKKGKASPQAAGKTGITPRTSSSEQRWHNPGTENKTTMSQVEDKSNKGVREIDSATNKSQERMYEKASEQYSMPKSKLDPNAGANIAKTGGQYGSLTGKNFYNTLNLVRQADAYNNKPQDYMFSVGTRHTGGVKNLGIGYDRPKIETEEMREMSRNRQLDLNQKQLAQALQDAVNHKDLNAFIQLYQYLYNTEITRNQAEILMRQWTRQQEMSNILSKDITTFNAFFSRYFNEETCRYLYELGLQNPVLSNMLSQSILVGTVTPDTEQYLNHWVEVEKTNEKIRAYYRKYGKMPPAEEQWRMYRLAQQEMERTERLSDNVDEAAIKQDSSMLQKSKAKKQAKELGK